MPADQPTPERVSPHLKVVSLHDRSGLAARLAGDSAPAVPWFRPIVDLRRGEAAGYEVLLAFDGGDPRAPRAWSQDVHPRQVGSVEGPLLSVALGERERLPVGCFLAVSLSAHGVLSEEVGAALTAAGRLDRVVLVVTDDSQGADPHDVRRVLDAARDAGATVAVDETASGYASLKQVLSLRPDFVRIGGDFIIEIDRDQAKAAVVETLGALASRIDSWVIAAGIPGSGELDTLRRLGVPLGEGPLFGRPLPRMGPLEGRVTRLIEEAPPIPGGEETVAPLVEARPPVPWSAPIEDLADAFLDDPRHDVVVLVDERSRPLALAERAALLRGEPYERPVMRITPSSPLKAVARRAAARPVLERYHPLVACDRRGVYLGVVRVEQLLDALAREG
jgi:EAL domain-containing protein (putative c-di-GMP-specific phosphodiesterase class I)